MTSAAAARKKKFKLQSVSVGDCIHEQSSASGGGAVGGSADHVGATSPKQQQQHHLMSVRSLTSDVATSQLDLTPPNARTPHPISPAQIKGKRGSLDLVVVAITSRVAHPILLHEFTRSTPGLNLTCFPNRFWIVNVFFN